MYNELEITFYYIANVPGGGGGGGGGGGDGYIAIFRGENGSRTPVCLSLLVIE